MKLFMARTTGLAGVLIAFIASGCAGATNADTPAPAEAAVVSASPISASRSWTEPGAYSYLLTTGCTRGFEDARYRVVVRAGETVSTTALNRMAEDHAGFRAPTLGEIDTWITQDPRNPRLRRDRDPVDGHPVAFGFDPDTMAVDAGVCYAVSRYELQ